MSKTKYILYFCPQCNKETKMEILGSMEGMENKVWYRCSRCRHSLMVDTSRKREETNIIKISRENCISYSPEKTYEVGAFIYHSDWDDMGKVTAKEKTSSGAKAIVVAFERLGARKLIENLQAE